MKYNIVKHTLQQFQGMTIEYYNGYDDCAIGFDYDGENVRIIYSVSKIINEIMKQFGYTELEALEDFEYTFRGFRTGEPNEPILCQDDF